MTADSPEAVALRWRIARRSAGNGACVEVASANAGILVRDSKDQDGPAMPYSGISWRRFLAEAKAGQFDLDFL